LEGLGVDLTKEGKLLLESWEFIFLGVAIDFAMRPAEGCPLFVSEVIDQAAATDGLEEMGFLFSGRIESISERLYA